MSKTSESLTAALVAKGISSEESARIFAETLDDIAAKNLLDFLLEQEGGRTENLPGGEGGMIAGLRKILASRRSDTTARLPASPHNLSREDKANVIKDLDERLKVSSAEFAEGLKLILAAKSSERLNALSAWVSELSDEDFPVAIESLRARVSSVDENLAEKVKGELEAGRDEIASLARRHRDLSDT